MTIFLSFLPVSLRRCTIWMPGRRAETPSLAAAAATFSAVPQAVAAFAGVVSDRNVPPGQGRRAGYASRAGCACR